METQTLVEDMSSRDFKGNAFADYTVLINMHQKDHLAIGGIILYNYQQNKKG